MFTFTGEFFIRALIGFILGLLVNCLICNSQLNHAGALFKTGKSRKLQLLTKQSTNKTYSPDLEKLWNDLRQLYGKRTELDPKFSFNKMAFDKLLGEGKQLQRPQYEIFTCEEQLRGKNPLWQSNLGLTKRIRKI